MFSEPEGSLRHGSTRTEREMSFKMLFVLLSKKTRPGFNLISFRLVSKSISLRKSFVVCRNRGKPYITDDIALATSPDPRNNSIGSEYNATHGNSHYSSHNLIYLILGEASFKFRIGHTHSLWLLLRLHDRISEHSLAVRPFLDHVTPQSDPSAILTQTCKLLLTKEI
ncbi:hypothetical protein NPIL_315441 [Nephila pilipes]|uniref:Uncharacterized protein n=1 Tax=Nephila pilipes TaxID=299642 RepID=A0A8X6U9C7_NEPPI|nr:hypothetical protein NPIL_315441 [Nephila pilipes]